MIKVNIFSLGLFLRIAVLLGCCLLVGNIFFDQDWIFTQLVLFSAIILSTLELYKYLSVTNIELTKLLESIKYEEYDTSFSKKNFGNSYNDLFQVMEDIKEDQKNKSGQLKKQLFLFEKVINKTELGIVVINNQHEIVLQSESATEILESPQLATVKDIERNLPGIGDKIIDSSDDSRFIYKSRDLESPTSSSSLIFHILKFKYYSTSYTLLIVSKGNEHQADGDFETWINFSKVISHEILNGISPIISLTNTLQTKLDKIEGNEKTTESMQKALNIILERSNSLQTYSEKYRTLQRLPEPKKEILKWSDLINKCIGLNQNKLKNSNITCSVSGESLEESFKGDSWQMDQVFSNLLLNSMQSLDQEDSSNKKIEIKVSTQGLYYLVNYTDNGIGIHKDIRANVFTPFFTTRDSGSGIGLSVIKQILWKHNGEIFLQDTEKGVSFIIKFPILN